MRKAFGGLDILVNNAAPGRARETIGRIADADWDEHQSIVLRAAATMVEAALPDLIDSGHGAIVNVLLGSRRITVGADQSSVAYHVAKAGLDQFTRWLAVRCGGQGLRVNAVAPGLVDRDVGRKLTDDPANKRVVEAVVPAAQSGDGTGRSPMSSPSSLRMRRPMSPGRCSLWTAGWRSTKCSAPVAPSRLSHAGEVDFFRSAG